MCYCFADADVEDVQVPNKTGEAPDVNKLLLPCDDCIKCQKTTFAIGTRRDLPRIIAFRRSEQVREFSCNKTGTTRLEPVVVQQITAEGGMLFKSTIPIGCKLSKSLTCQTEALADRDALHAVQRAEPPPMKCKIKSSIKPYFGNCTEVTCGGPAGCSAARPCIAERAVPPTLKTAKGNDHCAPYAVQW
jgi:hypothetical protein